MKPHGPIPPGFHADSDGMLLIGGDRAGALADMAGDTPLFVYDSAMLRARVARMPGVVSSPASAAATRAASGKACVSPQ